jgi:hypothetical protein
VAQLGWIEPDNGPDYRFSWIIGTVFCEIRTATVPITSRKTVKTAPIRSVIDPVQWYLLTNCAAVIYFAAMEIFP